jgi:peptide/nickel transport system substrate-binding protein
VWAFFLPKVDAIQAPDADTVRITLKAPERSLPAAMTRIPIEDVTTLKQIDHDPVVTGQYKVASFTPDQNLVLERNPDYHGPPAKLDRVTVTKAQDNTAAFTSLRAGDIQVLWSIPWTDVRQLTGGDDGKIVVNTGDKPLQNVILMTDNKHGIFTNVKARQAGAYALDRAAVLKAIYADRGVVPRGTDPVPPWSALAKKDLPSYDFDLNKAKALFKEAGFGPNTPLTYLTPTGQYTEWTSIGEVLQNDLKKIGIPMKIETVEINQYAARIAPAGKKWPNVIAPNIYGGLPVSLIPAWWAPGVCECNFDNAAYNKALTDAEAAPDDTAFRAAVDQSQEVFNAQVPSVLVVHTALPVATVSSLKNVWIDPTGNARFGDAGYAK